jgi:glycosyltransferase involved in cell wall biosynthesis
LATYGTPTLAWSVLQRLQRDRRAYRLARASHAALYHYHSVEFIRWGGRLRRLSRRPVIFDCREDFEAYARQRRGIPASLRGPLAYLMRRQLRYAARSCDAIITADHGTAAQLRPEARRLVVVHNFPRLDLFPYPAATGLEPPFDIIYHGSLPRYHLEVCLAIDAALVQRGYSAQWRLIGKGMPEAAWFRQQLAQRGIAARFSICGIMPHERIAAELGHAKLGLIPLPDLPKFRTNIPRKLFEFMAMGLPVVMSDLPPSRPFVGDGTCAVMVPPHDYGAYAAAIVRLLRDPGLRRQMGEAGRKKVEQDYNWQRESRKLLDLYAELLTP